MTGRGLGRWAASVLVACALQGCATTGGRWHIPWLGTSSSQTSEKQPSKGAEQAPTSGARRAEHKAASQEGTKSAGGSRVTGAQGASAGTKESPAKPGSEVPAPTPTVSLEDNMGSRKRALTLVDQADKKLAGVDPKRLDTQDAVTYDQAKRFLVQAHSAVDESDYLAASGFATKASILAESLTPQKPGK